MDRLINEYQFATSGLGKTTLFSPSLAIDYSPISFTNNNEVVLPAMQTIPTQNFFPTGINYNNNLLSQPTSALTTANPFVNPAPKATVTTPTVLVKTRIIDTTGLPVPANVKIEGQSNVYAANANGEITFNAPADKRIFVEYLGYATQSFLSAGVPATITLKETSTDMAQATVKNTYKFPWLKVILGTVVVGGILVYATNKKNDKPSPALGKTYKVNF